MVITPHVLGPDFPHRRAAEFAAPDDERRIEEPPFLEVEEEGGFRRVPEIGMGNFLWASDFPGLDSPWPYSKQMGHAPAEAALGNAALNQLVFENAVSLYKIPVTLAQ